MSGEQKLGLYRKYEIKRMDGSSEKGQKHHGCRYFPLDLTHDPFAKVAVLAYAKACRRKFPVLAQDLAEIAGQAGYFAGGRTELTLRCIGPQPGNNHARCKRRYTGQPGWDFVSIRPLEGWVCPECRKRLGAAFNGPGLPRPMVTKKRRA